MRVIVNQAVGPPGGETVAVDCELDSVFLKKLRCSAGPERLLSALLIGRRDQHDAHRFLACQP